MSDLGDLFQRAADLLGAKQSEAQIHVGKEQAARRFNPPKDIVDLQDRLAAVEERLARIEEPESIELAQTEFVGSSGVTVNVYGTADPATIAREIENALRPPLKFGSPLIGCECDACA